MSVILRLNEGQFCQDKKMEEVLLLCTDYSRVDAANLLSDSAFLTDLTLRLGNFQHKYKGSKQKTKDNVTDTRHIRQLRRSSDTDGVYTSRVPTVVGSRGKANKEAIRSQDRREPKILT